MDALVMDPVEEMIPVLVIQELVIPILLGKSPIVLQELAQRVRLG
jgi:hypothetical protein